MGIDWVRVQVKRTTDPAQLNRLIEQQAITFQSIWAWNSCAWTDWVWYDLCNRLHFETYRAASNALRDLFEFPEWDDEQKCSVDISDLEPSWRVKPITDNPIFPPLWRMRAHRTILPDQLHAQLLEWKAWARQAANGEHDDYVRELHMHVTSDFMKHHWSSLRTAAMNSLTQAGNWAKNPALIEVREKIIRLPEPTVSRVRIEPSERQSVKREAFDAQYVALFKEVRTLIELTHAWDSNVRGNKKLRYYENYYQLTLDEFRNNARDSWLEKTFEWATRCCQQGFGLFLNY